MNCELLFPIQILRATWAGALSLTCLLSSVAYAQNWADRLGFPAGGKVLLLHAHELGMCYESNAAVERLLEGEVVRSASAMATCPWFAKAAKWRQAHPDADVGLELTLNSEFDDYRWKPVSLGDAARSLRDDQGFLWQSPIQTMVNATAEDVERELLAQISYAKEVGLNPTHLTTHLGALITRPDLIEMYLRIAREKWIPAVVVEMTPEHVARFEEQGFPIPDDIIELVSNYPLPKVDDLKHLAAAESYEQKKQDFLALLNDVAPGITQIAFRPAVATDGLPGIADDWQQRAWEADLFADPEVQAAIRDKQFILTDWRELMQRFGGEAAEDSRESEAAADNAAN
jgi:chitin disaccharide deacetylase